MFYESNWQSDLKSHISSLHLTTPSCCGSDRETGYKQRRWKARQQKPVWDAIGMRFPAAGTPLTPSPTLKLSEAMCSLHYKGFCSRMRHPSLPSDVFFLHLPLTLSQFLRMSKRQGRTLHLHPNMRKCLIYTLARTKKQFECNIKLTNDYWNAL